MWELIDRKHIEDSDGFLTEYSMYYNGNKYVFVYGDSELYRPEDEYWDWETESEEEAYEWFNGF